MGCDLFGCFYVGTMCKGVYEYRCEDGGMCISFEGPEEIGAKGSARAEIAALVNELNLSISDALKRVEHEIEHGSCDPKRLGTLLHQTMEDISILAQPAYSPKYARHWLVESKRLSDRMLELANRGLGTFVDHADGRSHYVPPVEKSTHCSDLGIHPLGRLYSELTRISLMTINGRHREVESEARPIFQIGSDFRINHDDPLDFVYGALTAFERYYRSSGPIIPKASNLGAETLEPLQR
ncbi:MAG: hypothetical protein HN337_02855 [Deltaproteobacteria bacterium]|jgi:hypothetical protein|nr:hypothetical protein [Deltaproteobacteria bacterium]